MESQTCAYLAFGKDSSKEQAEYDAYGCHHNYLRRECKKLLLQKQRPALRSIWLFEGLNSKKDTITGTVLFIVFLYVSIHL